MKQNITREQLWQLVGKQDEVLYKWCKEKGYLTKENSIPLLTIGQMIEFLGDDYIFAIVNESFYSKQIKYAKVDDICDFLFDQVKYKLKNL